MLYRPHFPYATPEGCRDEPFEYFFQVTIPVGTTPAVILGPLEKDAPFFLRGVRITHNGDPGQEVAIQFRMPDGTLLSDDEINTGLYTQGAGIPAGQGGMAVAYDVEIALPAGATIESDWIVQ